MLGEGKALKKRIGRTGLRVKLSNLIITFYPRPAAFLARIQPIRVNGAKVDQSRVPYCAVKKDPERGRPPSQTEGGTGPKANNKAGWKERYQKKNKQKSQAHKKLEQYPISKAKSRRFHSNENQRQSGMGFHLPLLFSCLSSRPSLVRSRESQACELVRGSEPVPVVEV
ncbi:hypothetical protein LIER_43653 [Lithospermum erythrorhizon]|uniref:Uncharacterized protein n=1 Tax=Lithospermum erythrorhizon TaxID=34254 RepID=A0AAV3QLC7_LITER